MTKNLLAAALVASSAFLPAPTAHAENWPLTLTLGIGYRSGSVPPARSWKLTWIPFRKTRRTARCPRLSSPTTRLRPSSLAGNGPSWVAVNHGPILHRSYATKSPYQSVL